MLALTDKVLGNVWDYTRPQIIQNPQQLDKQCMNLATVNKRLNNIIYNHPCMLMSWHQLPNNVTQQFPNINQHFQVLLSLNQYSSIWNLSKPYMAFHISKQIRECYCSKIIDQWNDTNICIDFEYMCELDFDAFKIQLDHVIFVYLSDSAIFVYLSDSAIFVYLSDSVIFVYLNLQ